MGYESKIYFCNEYDFPDPIHHCEIIAMIDMCKMGYSDTVREFLKCFDTETEFSLYLPECDEEGNEVMTDVIEDKYGARLKYASNVQLLHRWAVQMAKEDKYWRFSILASMIEKFKCYPDVKIVHFGY